jgi:hypothetical protein
MSKVGASESDKQKLSAYIGQVFGLTVQRQIASNHDEHTNSPGQRKRSGLVYTDCRSEHEHAVAQSVKKLCSKNSIGQSREKNQNMFPPGIAEDASCPISEKNQKSIKNWSLTSRSTS